MAKKRITIVPNLDTSAPSVKNGGKCRFRIMVRINGVASPYRTDLFMHKEFWVHETERDEVSGKIRELRKMRIKHGRGNSDSGQLEMDLNALVAKMKSIIDERQRNKQAVTHKALKGLWENRDNQGDSILAFAEKQILKLAEKVAQKKKSKRTLTGWKCYARYLEEYDRHVAFRDVDHEWLDNYYNWLAFQREGGYRRRNQDRNGKLGMSIETVNGAFFWLGKMFKKAKKLGATQMENPLEAWRNDDDSKDNFKDNSTQRKSLSWDEVLLLHETYKNEDLLKEASLRPHERRKLHNCLQHYLTGIYTGLRYSDLKEMHDLSNIEYNGAHISKVMVKTKRRITLWISEPLREILDFQGVMTKGSLFDSHVQCPSSANRNLRKVLGLVGIEGYYQMHDLRRTFASVMQNAGVDIYKVSKLLGHHSVEETKKYVITSDEALDDAMRVWNNFAKNEKGKSIGDTRHVDRQWLADQLRKLEELNPGLILSPELEDFVLAQTPMKRDSVA